MGWMDLWSLENHEKYMGCIGDEGWDLAQKFLDDLDNIYLKRFGRKASIDEIRATLEFILPTENEEE